MFRLFERFRKRPQQDAWSASAYLYDDTLIVHANNRTYNNIGWNSEPVSTIAYNADNTLIGHLVRSTVLASRWDAEHADSLGSDNPVLKAAGVKSWTAMERKALLIHVGLRDDTFTVIPNRATLRGEGRGWSGLDEHITLPEDCTDAELGDAVARAFGMCIPWKPKR
jgi:hypothetical protein